ncbi:hypothetical protein L332_12970 [Agrococcus pavilionensis RW1]|uniref:Uncharacterized protein n=1 Tax=Agrococcus pavilionensis RW1 TaxID=1330458 RepID=U1LS40_9MICO|nr:hypothetical protein L332_12970 [Agrococcus pavilionensis RW1]
MAPTVPMTRVKSRGARRVESRGVMNVRMLTVGTPLVFGRAGDGVLGVMS